MRTKLLAGFFLAALFGRVTPAWAQYFDTTVLEKSFEQMDLFFRPGYVNPYGFEGFGPVAPGLISNTILNAELNPAFPATDSIGSSYGYIDFRQSRQPKQPDYCCVYLYDSALRSDVYYPYPYYPAEQPDTPEPLFALGYFARPVRQLAIGVTYQLLFRDSDYFAVPADIYRASATEDFASNPVVSSDAYPITDVANGENSMRTSGHQASLNLASSFGRLSVGARAGASFLDRNGTLANTNSWNYRSQVLSTSLWENEETRSIDYSHFDVSLGALYKVSPTFIAGVSGGLLTGTATQYLTRSDTSFYLDGNTSSTTNYGLYTRGGSTDQHWSHDGGSAWVTANLRTTISDRASLSAIYRFEYSDLDLSFNSTVRDTANSVYEYSYDATASSSLSHSSLMDVRSGDGNSTGSLHRAALIAHWQLDEKTLLSLGGDVNSRLTRTTTTEDVLASRHSFWSYEYDSGLNVSEFGSDEDKTLNWLFRARTTTLSFPIYLQKTISDRIRLEFGINRRLVLWNISDETTGLFARRAVLENGVLTSQDNFGERYREPTNRESEVRTTFLAGVTVSPNGDLDIRFLVAPEHYQRYNNNHLDMRWWIGLALHP